MRINGVVTEDRMTGDRYITNVMIMEDTVSPKPQESEKRHSESASNGKYSFVMSYPDLIIHKDLLAM